MLIVIKIGTSNLFLYRGSNQYMYFSNTAFNATPNFLAIDFFPSPTLKYMSFLIVTCPFNSNKSTSIA